MKILLLLRWVLTRTQISNKSETDFKYFCLKYMKGKKMEAEEHFFLISGCLHVLRQSALAGGLVKISENNLQLSRDRSVFLLVHIQSNIWIFVCIVFWWKFIQVKPVLQKVHKLNGSNWSTRRSIYREKLLLLCCVNYVLTYHTSKIQHLTSKLL